MEMTEAHWQATTNTLATGVVRCRIAEQGTILSYSDVVGRWQSAEFAEWFNGLLASFEFSAFFWECRPVSRSDLDNPFEFVLLRARALEGVAADSSAFENHFRTAGRSSVVVFPNLGRDATLVVPVPIGTEGSYAHLAAFTRSAPDGQHVDFWAAVGRQTESSISAAPIWVSTCGLGVYWLHARIDSWPKYYQFSEYRNVVR